MVPPETVESLLARAEDDLQAAEIIRRENDEMTMIICFHLQQYVEKVIKAKLKENGIYYPSKHNIVSLLALFPDSTLAEDYLEDASLLSDYATSARYDSIIPTVEQMNSAFDRAEKIVKAVKTYKPS